MTVTSTEELIRALSGLSGGNISLEGFYDGYEGLYRYPVVLSLEEE
jgi:hypothetical protein